MRPSVDLPQPDSPDETQDLTLGHVEADAIDSLDITDLAAQQPGVDGVVLVTVLHGDNGWRSGPAPPGEAVMRRPLRGQGDDIGAAGRISLRAPDSRRASRRPACPRRHRAEQLRVVLAAGLETSGTAGSEVAATGMLKGLGTEPLMTLTLPSVGACGHRFEQAPGVRMPGRREDLLDRPGLDDSAPYITATWSTISATTPRSWVISIRAMPRSACEARMRSRIWAWTVTSSAVVGSSAMSILGSQERPMAIMAAGACRPTARGDTA